MSDLPVLSILIFLPVAAAIACLVSPGPREDATVARWMGLVARNSATDAAPGPTPTERLPRAIQRS